MADKKRGKKRRDEYTGPGGASEEVEKVPNQEYAIAKWLRKNVPTKKTKFINHNVEYFTSSKALDAIMTSKWAMGDEPLLPTREAAIEFFDSMLRHKFFHRAVKVPVSEQELKARRKGDKDKDKEKEKDKDKDIQVKTSTDKTDGNGTDAESSHVEGKDKEKPVEKEKRKRKIRLDMHLSQVFVDGPEAYVWIYDPIPMHYWLFGALLVLGAIGICMFPLWPPSVRKGVYYLSLAAAGFLVFIIALAVLRVIVFCGVWILTFGNHHLWLFPNLTEDVGFFQSFWPVYHYEYKGGDQSSSSSSKKKTKKKKKDKDSDNEETPLLEQEPSPITSPRYAKRPPTPDTETAETKPEMTKQDRDTEPDTVPEPASESESESSQQSSTGRDFEMVDSQDMESS